MFRRSLSVQRSLSAGPARPPERRRERIVSENWLKQSVAEAIGTFALIFVGVLSISAAGIVGAPGGLATLASIGLAHGLTVAVMVAALGAISGGHFNPAVTFGFVITGRMKPATGGMYWIAQLVGASAAGLLIAALFGGGPVAGGTPDLGRGVGVGAGIVVEAVATFFLVLVVFGTAVDERAPAAVFPLAIGLTLAPGVMAGGPLTAGCTRMGLRRRCRSSAWRRHLLSGTAARSPDSGTVPRGARPTWYSPPAPAATCARRHSCTLPKRSRRPAWARCASTSPTPKPGAKTLIDH